MAYRFGTVVLWAAALGMGLGGCSTRAWYEGMKLSAENECQKQPPGAREDCLAKLNRKTYDAYEKERATVP